MIDSARLLEAIDRKIKPWLVSKTFETELEAKRHAGRLFVHVAGVRVAPFAGGTFSVLSWTKELPTNT